MTIEQPPPLSIVSDMKKNLQIFVLKMPNIITIIFFQTFEKS